MKPSAKPFGEGLAEEFSVGDIVSWTRLGNKYNIGMVYEIYTEKIGGRQVQKVWVASFKDTKHYSLLAVELKIVSKVTN